MNASGTRTTHQLVLRALSAMLGSGYLATGMWALLSPTNWTQHYPGFGRHWLSHDVASPHFIADLSVGFLAVGAALVVAALTWRRGSRQIAGVALAAHAIPHFAYHVLHPDPMLPTLDVLLGVWGLAPQAALGLALVTTSATRRNRPLPPQLSR